MIKGLPSAAVLVGMNPLLSALALILLTGCGMLTPPDSYSIDPRFTDAEADEIRQAVALWSEVTSWRPNEVSVYPRGDTKFVATPADVYELLGRPERSGAFESGQDVAVNIDFIRETETSLLWIVAHEIGHFCIDGHARGSDLLMSAEVSKGADAPEQIDAVSAGMWEDGCL